MCSQRRGQDSADQGASTIHTDDDVAGLRCLRLPEVLAIIPVSKSTWWAGVKSHRYPQPLRDGSITMWRLRDIERLVASWEQPRSMKQSPQ
jgi:prophage regulatory protein